MEAHRQKPQAGFLDALTGLHSLRGVVDARARAFTPCHCDLLPENILDDGKRLFIIDYEFSGNCDPLWDLGDFSGEAELGEAQDRVLLLSYFGGSIPPEAQALFSAYKAVSLLLAAGWAQVQIANANTIEDFESYAKIRLARCWEAMESRDLQRLIEELTARGADQPSRARGASFKGRGRRRDESEASI